MVAVTHLAVSAVDGRARMSISISAISALATFLVAFSAGDLAVVVVAHHEVVM